MSPKCIERQVLEEDLFLLFKTLSIVYLEPAGEGKRRNGIIMHNIAMRNVMVNFQPGK